MLAAANSYLSLQDKLGKFAMELGGKDKVFRLTCYLCRFLLCFSRVQASVFAEPLRTIYNTFGQCRKMFRFGKLFVVLNMLMVAAHRKEGVMWLLEMLKNAVQVVYLTSDHLSWVGANRVWNVDAAKHGYRATVAWFTTLTIDIVIDVFLLIDNFRQRDSLLAMEKKLQRERLLQQLSNDNIEEESVSQSFSKRHRDLNEELRKLKEARINLYLNFLKNFLDYPIGFAGTFSKDWNQTMMATFGVLSSTVNLYQGWVAFGK